MSESREAFNDALQQHKTNLTRAMIDGGEGKRVNGLLRDIDSNVTDYEYYFYAAWQKRQKQVDELQERLDLFKSHSLMLRDASKSFVYNEREKNILISQADDIDKMLGLEQALKGGED